MSVLRPALESFLDLLHCPTCRAHLHPRGGALRCLTGHTFDVARHGYVSLLSGTSATSGDDAAMARARARFLSTGKYGPIRQAVARLATDAVTEQGTVVDVGRDPVRAPRYRPGRSPRRSRRRDPHRAHR